MTNLETDELRDLYGQLGDAVCADDRTEVARLSWLILNKLLQQNVGDDMVEKVERVLAELATVNLNTVESIGTLDDPRVEYQREPVRKMGASPHDTTVPDVDDGSYRVWFGTNRRPNDADDPSQGFAFGVDDKTHYGCADVIIPPAHRVGELGTSWLKRVLRFDLRDDDLVLQSLRELGPADFWQHVREENQQAVDTGGGNDSVIFIHGYNTSFEAAAIRAAQIGFDLNVPGVMAMFSWPSHASVVKYTEDGYHIKESEQAIEDFLVDFALKSGAGKVHVIAHSMGNRGFVASLARIAADASRQGVRFGQFIFAAPDVEQHDFVGGSAHFGAGERATLYTSSGDRAVYISRWRNNNERAGYFVPYTVGERFDTIAVPDFDLDLFGHAYFAQAKPLLSDIRSLMRNNDDPLKRMFLSRRELESGHYFEMRE